MLTATVCGSFHRHMSAITLAVRELTDIGVHVLSPADPTVVEARGEFLFVASDHVRSVRLVEDRHLESIKASDFLWLVAPDGYVGQSASLELGFAVATDVPIFCSVKPYDLTLRQYVREVSGASAAVRAVQALDGVVRPPHFLLDPHASVDEAQRHLERIRAAFRRPARDIDDEAAVQIYAERDRLLSVLSGAFRD